jgi:DNA-binding NarL/FixJ family response regulator
VRIGILLGVMPRMLYDVVSQILSAEPDMLVVAEGVEDDVLVARVERERPDVVVVAVPAGAPPALCGELLSRFPRLTVVTLEDRGQRGSIYTLRPMRVRLDDLSSARLVDAIRRAAAPTPFLSSVYDADAQLLETAGPSPGGPERPPILRERSPL